MCSDVERALSSVEMQYCVGCCGLLIDITIHSPGLLNILMTTFWMMTMMMVVVVIVDRIKVESCYEAAGCD